MLHQAEERQRSGAPPTTAATRWTRFQEYVMAWVAERIAEQRLLWNLRRESAVVAAHPQDLTFDQALTLIRRTLQRDYERHRLWLVVDGVLLILSGVLMPFPDRTSSRTTSPSASWVTGCRCAGRLRGCIASSGPAGRASR